jgi:hypothetical protein
MSNGPRARVEEYFDAVVEEVTDDAVRLRTRSSNGEQGTAWLPRTKIPAAERKYIVLGAPLRITIFATARRRRKTEVRFLRPSEWYRPTAAEREPVAQMLLEHMRAVLAHEVVGDS